ncbi:MAG: lysophospholipid acyltransferase family protein [Pseudomonadales bacterium]|nr:lysophospholipid acyltransferase family protein [Pseudomonadales bacterium]
MRITDQIAGRAITGLMWLFSLMPLGLSQVLGRRIGDLIFKLDTRGAKVTRTNLEVCMPALSSMEREAMVRRSLQQTGMMMMETPASWLGGYDRVLGWIQKVEGETLLDEAMASGKGVIVILPHIGNWELINVYMASKGGNQTGLYAPPNQDYLKPLMSTIRNRFGNDLVPTTKKGIATLFRRLQEGSLVVVLPDQVPASGKFVPFFGEDALTDVLITRLLRRSQATVLCCVIERLPGAKGFMIHFTKAHEDIYASDEDVALLGLNKSVEACVQMAPDQYQWEYKRYKERPPGNVRLYNYDNEPMTHH